MVYEGNAYQAPSGQWSWVISGDGEDIVRGAGYETEDAALQDMYEELRGRTETL